MVKAAAAAMLLSVWLAGCSSSQSKDAGAAKAGSAAMNSAKNDAAAVGTNSSSATQSGAAKEALPAVSPGAGFTGKDGAPASADPFSRKIIYSGRLTMQVDNYAQKQAEVQEAVKLAGMCCSSTRACRLPKKAGT
ncbi:hypothetical protein O9H85_01955 [Paenibacillus filicis]|uniref:SPOR domain-containing protein n=1 Tax=Paenibacillus gyeongsangnamensis TaxID=3388067 RepID=A0ABT4Q375_9BACL|nr:hypothetical protein [Paenibacillus filicis]MCZ8511222.1 hypothetical protein [Paenibacillus filicis]